MASLNSAKVVSTLDELDMLELGETGPWPGEPEAGQSFGIDWGAANAEWQNEDAESPIDVSSAWRRVADELVGTDKLVGTDSGGPRPPPKDVPDAYAWYCPIHFYGPSWGIYIKESAVLELSRGIISYLSEPRRSELEVIASAARMALAMLYLHEAFHHKTESFAIRLEIVEHARRYVPYYNQVFAKVANTDDHLEEGLAWPGLFGYVESPG
jgi:hypothetical protein